MKTKTKPPKRSTQRNGPTRQTQQSHEKARARTRPERPVHPDATDTNGDDLQETIARVAQLEAKIRVLQLSRAMERTESQYGALVERIRSVVDAALPPEATVIVVSKGDNRLLNLHGRQGQHFPQTQGGGYAGSHPADSSEAIAHLEELRNRKCDFLLFPATAFWWLEFYRDFKVHLDQHYPLVTYVESVCAIYALRRTRLGELAQLAGDMSAALTVVVCAGDGPDATALRASANSQPAKRPGLPRSVCNHQDITVSVVMTTYNSERFVGSAIQSLLQQTHSNLEVVVVDDASTDGTFDKLRELAAADPRVRPIKSFHNRGTYWCKNFGLTKASGSFITFQDSDDTSDPRRIELQLLELLKREHTLICTCNYVRIGHQGEVVLNRGRQQRTAIMAPLFRKSDVLARVGYFDSVRTSADSEFFNRATLALGDSDIAHVDAPLYLARLREGSLTHSAGTEVDMQRASANDDLSFLSASRQEYRRQYTAWHQKVKDEKADPFISFPLIRRPFPAPSRLLPASGSSDEHVTASVASIPERQNLLKLTVASILPQVDTLNVYLNGYSATPRFLAHPKVHVIHSAEYGDLQDSGKFFFLDSLTWGYHFTIDDDILYPPNYVQKNILKIEQYNRQAIVGSHGVILSNPVSSYLGGREVVLHFSWASATDRFVNILGTGTTAYHLSTVALSRSDFRLAGMADLWLAIAAKRQRVPMIAVERSNSWLIPLMEGDETSIYARTRLDDSIQTQLVREAESWQLEQLYPFFPMTNWLSQFSADELRSQSVDPHFISWLAGRPREDHNNRNMSIASGHSASR